MIRMGKNEGVRVLCAALLALYAGVIPAAAQAGSGALNAAAGINAAAGVLNAVAGESAAVGGGSAVQIVLGADEAVDYALKNSRTLKSAAIDLEIKKRKKDNSWNVFIPSVSVTGTMSRSNEVMPTAYNPDPTEIDHWKAVGNMSVNLTLSAALLDGIKATKANYEAGLISWNQSLKETELNIRKMFYGLLVQQESIKLQETALENAKNRWDQAKTNFKNGLVPELSVLQAQVAYENQKPSILKQKQAAVQQLDMFAFLLGLPFGSKIVLSGTIDPQFCDVNPSDLTAQYLENRLDVQSLRKNIEMMEISLSASKVQTYTPALVLGWGVQPVVSDVSSNWFEDSNNFDNGSLSATLSFNLSNMLPFSSNMQNIADTKANIAKMKMSLDTVRQNAEMEIHTLAGKLSQSRSAIDASKMSIDLARKAYKMTMDAYKSGTKELLDVRDAESQMNQAELGLLNEKYTYLSALLDLEYAVNTKLSLRADGQK